MTTRPDLHERFLAIVQRAAAREAAEAAAIGKPRGERAAWGRPGQAAKGARKGAAKVRKPRGQVPMLDEEAFD